ncbi:MAG: PDZ domain-containing protein, partial [Gemmatimonadales bacterium]
MIRLRCIVLLALAPSPLVSQSPLRTYSDAVIQRYDRTAPKVDYTVTVRPADRSAFFVELRIANPPNPARLVIPDWAPGAYRPMRSGDNIADVAATTGGGEPLAVTRASPIAWSVDTRGAATIVVRYSTAVRRPAEWARANNRWFLRRSSGLIDGPRTFMYLDGWALAPSHVTFRLPPGWRIGTGLVPTTDSAVYWAPSYDVLIDSPVLLGVFVAHRFTAGGVPHRAVVDLNGGRPTYDARRFVDMLRRICEAGIAVFGSAPYKDYTFIFAGVGGGLEHLNSTTIGFSVPRMQRNPLTHEGVTAHEFFHTWNVKRIRPAELGPFDYTRPVRTVSLWVSEGITDYYTNVLLARGGLDSEADFARNIATAIASHRGNPARLVVSPERSSWTVWDSPTATDSYVISYYLQGELLGLLLDLTIRDSTDNAKSLDDVMRYLFDHFGGERGFTSEDLRTAIRAATGGGPDFRDFWRRYVSGTTEIPWDEYLQAAGWSVGFSEQPATDARIGTITPAVQGGRWRAVAVPGSAAAAAGLVTGDELVRVNGRAILDGSDATAVLRAVPSGGRVT